MKRGLIAAALLLSACASTPPPAPPAMLTPVSAGVDQAGNRLEPLRGEGGEEEQHCTFDGAWCVDGAGFTHAGQTIAPPPRERGEPSPWPFALHRAAGGAPLLGVLWRTTDSYSGGGASQTVLVLYRIDGPRAEPVLEILQAGDALIRACFSETDMRTRAGACHDDYRFSSHLSLDPANAGAWPVLRYESEAARFPGVVSRSEDSSARAPLTRADLVWAEDERCSVARVFAWNEARGAYAPNQPLPDCADYQTQ